MSTYQQLREQIAPLLRLAIKTDGAHHKQWVLEEIAAILNIKLPSHTPGIEP
jgi:hypothetical protein